MGSMLLSVSLSCSDTTAVCEWLNGMNTEKNVIYSESTGSDTGILHFKEFQCNKYPLMREQFLPLDEQK